MTVLSDADRSVRIIKGRRADLPDPQQLDIILGSIPMKYAWFIVGWLIGWFTCLALLGTGWLIGAIVA